MDKPGKTMEQIKTKGYHEEYLNTGRDTYLIGISFDFGKKNITDFEWEKI